MKIRLLAFATAAEALGDRDLELELPEGSRVDDLLGSLERRHPPLAELWQRLAVAVDGRIAEPDTPLSDGAEVALLPPVSGGSGASSARLVEGPLDGALIAAEIASPARGALLVFEGRVRSSHRGRPVSRLTYDAYRPMAEATLERIVRELENAGDGLRVAIAHRLGEVPAGETSVVIAAASPHRDAAYRASRLALERLKREVPIWKREHYADGSAAWREEEPLSEIPPTPPSAARGSAE